MRITTERLLLRPFEAGDAQDLFEYLKKPTVNCFACEKIDTVEEAEKIIAERSKDDFCCAIVLKENSKVIGEIYSGAEGTDPRTCGRTHIPPAGCSTRAIGARGT